jgi:hypothetical protein
MDDLRPEEVQHYVLYREVFPDADQDPEHVRKKIRVCPLLTKNKQGRGRNETLIHMDRMEQLRACLIHVGVSLSELEETAEVDGAQLECGSSVARELDWRARIPPSLLDASLGDSVPLIARRLLFEYGDKIGLRSNEELNPPPPVPFTASTILVEHLDVNPLVEILSGQAGLRVSFRNASSKHVVPAYKSSAGFRLEYFSDSEPAPTSNSLDKVATCCYFSGLGLLPLVEATKAPFTVILVFGSDGRLMRVHEVGMCYQATRFEPETCKSYLDVCNTQVGESILENARLLDASSTQTSGEQTQAGSGGGGGGGSRKRKRSEIIRTNSLTSQDMSCYVTYRLYWNRMKQVGFHPAILENPSGDLYLMAYVLGAMALDALRVFEIQSSGVAPPQSSPMNCVLEEMYRLVNILSRSPWNLAACYTRLFYHNGNTFPPEIGMRGSEPESKHPLLDFRPHESGPQMKFVPPGSTMTTPFQTKQQYDLGIPYFRLIQSGISSLTQNKKRIRAVHIKERISGDRARDIRTLTTKEQMDICTNRLDMSYQFAKSLKRWDRVYVIRKVASSREAHKRLDPSMAMGFFREKARDKREDADGHVRSEFSKRMVAENGPSMREYRNCAQRIYVTLEEALATSGWMISSVEQPEEAAAAAAATGQEEEDEDDFVRALQAELHQEAFESEIAILNPNKRRKIHPAEDARRAETSGSARPIMTIQDLLYSEDMRAYFQWLERYLDPDVTVRLYAESQIQLMEGRCPKVSIVLKTCPLIEEITSPPAAAAAAASYPSSTFVHVPPVLSYCETPRLSDHPMRSYSSSSSAAAYPHMNAEDRVFEIEEEETEIIEEEEEEEDQDRFRLE